MVKSSGRTPSGPAPLSVWPVAAGGITGILVGVFFGDYAHFLRPVGNVYVMLLEVAVYPYLICSLMHGLGSLAPAQAWRLFLLRVEILRCAVADNLRFADSAGERDSSSACHQLGG